MPKISLLKARRNRKPDKLVPKTFKLHLSIADSFNRQAFDEGTNQVHLLERMIVFYLNNDGEKSKID